MSTAAQAPARERKFCDAKKRAGGTCRLPAGHGTDHVGTGRCRRHGGNTPNQRKAARRQEAEAAVVTYGLPREVDPHQALLEELHATAGHVAWLRELVAEMETAELHGPVGGSEHGFPREEPHVWVRLYQEERTHLVRVAKTCVDVGIEERRVRLAEQQGELLAQVIRSVVSALGHRPDDPRVREIVRRELTVIAGAS